MADKADWCDANVRHFIDICKGEIEAGNRPLGFFNRTGWKNVISKHEEKTGQKLTKKQLKNKWDNMKKEYTWFMELKNSATGLGWNEAKRTVERLILGHIVGGGEMDANHVPYEYLKGRNED